MNTERKTENNGLNNGRDETGKFLPGNPGKPKGSSKNKLRDEIKTFLNDNWKEFPTWFSELKAKEKITVILDLMPYAVSRLQSIAMTDSDGNQIEPSTDLTNWTDEDLKTLIALQQKYNIKPNHDE